MNPPEPQLENFSHVPSSHVSPGDTLVLKFSSWVLVDRGKMKLYSAPLHWVLGISLNDPLWETREEFEFMGLVLSVGIDTKKTRTLVVLIENKIVYLRDPMVWILRAGGQVQ